MLYFLIFIMSIYISTRGNLMYENITGISLNPQYHYLAIGYIIFNAFFFAYHMNKIYKVLPISQAPYAFIIKLTALIMSFGAICPYTLNQKDILSTLHVLCSMSGCVSFLVLLYLYTRKLSLYYPDIYLKIHWFYDASLQFLCLFLIVFTRVNGYIEIFFAFIVCTYLYLIEKYIYNA